MRIEYMMAYKWRVQMMPGILLIGVFCFLTDHGFAQSFRRGAIVLDFNTGLEVYQTRSTYQAGERDTTVKRLAANSNLAFGVEAGIGKRLGLGLRGKANTFYRVLDQVTQSRPDISTREIVLFLNFHPVLRKKFDLVVGSEIGLSGLSVDVNNLSNSTIEANGGFYAFYLNPRFYFGRIGLNFKTYLPFMHYGKLVVSNENPGEYLLSRWNGSGFGISAGLQFRFF